MVRFRRVMLGVVLGIICVMTVLAMAGIAMADGEWMTDGVMASATGVGFLLFISFGALSGLAVRGVRWLAFFGLAISFLMMLALPFWVLWDAVSRLGGATVGGPPPGSDNAVATGTVIAGFLSISAWAWSVRMSVAGRYVQIMTGVLLTVATAAYIALIWSDWAWKQVLWPYCCGLMVLTGAGVLVVLVMHALWGGKQREGVSVFQGNMFVRCPRCACEQEVEMGESRCVACKLRFVIEVEEPVCPKCAYNLRGLARPVCPECGTALDPAGVAGFAGPA
jgi:hypothetical protein